jgi:rhomboid protease GluP
MKVIYRSWWFRECAERVLVLEAMQIEYILERGMFGFRILVAVTDESAAREQLTLYRAENQVTAYPTNYAEPRAGAMAGAAGWCAVLLGVWMLQSRYAFDVDWVGIGRLNVAAVRDGEWWRAITALTLHADVAHLLVNLGVGALFGSLLARQIGPGLGWLMVLISGAAGNLVNVMVQNPSHSAIGASTSVFAALGLLSAYLWTSRRLIRTSWARRLSPVVGAAILLAWLGTGNERTDIFAHLTGFLCGFAIGVLLGRTISLREPDRRRQQVLGILCVLCIALAWGFALQ